MILLVNILFILSIWFLLGWMGSLIGYLSDYVLFKKNIINLPVTFSKFGILLGPLTLAFIIRSWYLVRKQYKNDS